METMPPEILEYFPIVLRQVSKKLRDDISIYNSWFKFDKNDDKIREEILKNRLRAKYLILDGTDLSWCFPNIKELKIVHTSINNADKIIDCLHYTRLENYL